MGVRGEIQNKQSLVPQSSKHHSFAPTRQAAWTFKLWLDRIETPDKPDASRKRRRPSRSRRAVASRAASRAIPLSPSPSDDMTSMIGEHDDETPRPKRLRANDDITSETNSSRSATRSSRSAAGHEIQQLEVTEEGGFDLEQIDPDNPLMPRELCDVVDNLRKCSRGLGVVHPAIKVSPFPAPRYAG